MEKLNLTICTAYGSTSHGVSGLQQFSIADVSTWFLRTTLRSASPLRSLIFTLFLCASAVGHTQDLCQIISGASVIADDGKFLGKLNSQYSSDSILNEYGTHGSQYSSDSIWNQYGTYGSAYSSLSPFNQYASTPPVLVKGGKVIALLTANKNLRGAVNPYVIKSCEFY